jgi:hypothetical protein
MIDLRLPDLNPREALPEVIAQLREWARSVREAFAEVPRVEVRELEIREGGEPVTISTALRPQCVTLAYLLDLEGSTTPPTAPAIHWEPVGEGVRIVHVYGLGTGKRYRLRVRMEE